MLIEQNGASFVDGAIMGSMALYGFKAPILVAGPSAAEWASKLHSVGFNIQCVGEQVGAASTTKMLRSVFTKGLEALVVETFYAASILGVENLIQDVLANTFDNETFAESVTRYLTSDAIHATRRIAEVEDVISVLKGLGVDPIMTEATMRRLRWSASLKLNEHFKGVTPQSGKEVLKAMLKAEGN